MSRQSLGLSPGHRRLRFSFQINDFKDPRPENRSHRLAPGCGGGGDVVASLSRVKRSFRRTISFPRPRPETREALFSASFSCVKWFFLKKNLCLQTTLVGRRRRLSKEGRSPCQPGFSSHFAETEIRRLQAAKNRLESREACLCFVRRFDWSAEPNRNTLRKQPAFATFFPGKPWETCVPAAPAAGPFPSEAAIYAATILSASRFRHFCEVSRGVPVTGRRDLLHSPASTGPARPSPLPVTPPLYRCAATRLPAWPRRSGI